MLISHLGIEPEIDPSAYIAPNATICGNIKIGKNSRIMFGATVVAEGGSIEIGANCVVLENAVLRSTVKHSLQIGDNVLIGPNAHVVGCTVENNVFIATGAAVFHGARLCEGSEVRIHGVVHIKTELPKNESVPIGWIAVGAPVKLLPPENHEAIWQIQKPLNFPEYVYGVARESSGQMMMPETMAMMTHTLESHRDDRITSDELRDSSQNS